MKTLLFTLLFSASIVLTANNTSIDHTPTIYEQLCQLNKYWQNQTNLKESLQQKVLYSNHEDLIQLHLQLVEQTLQEKNTSHLSALQKANRKEALKVLKEYALQKQFPKNTRHAVLTPYFIDDFNTACAVGHLMRESGAVEEAHWIAETMNNAYIEDMPVEELQQWADKMGFEVEELKWIQPSYSVSAFAEVQNADCHTANGNILMDIEGNAACSADEGFYYWYDYNYTEGSIKKISSSKNLENISSGFYCFLLKYSLEESFFYKCNTLRFIEVNDIDGPKIEASIQEPTMSQSDGVIELSISEGTPPYSVEWLDVNGTSLGNDLALRNLRGYGDPFYPQVPGFTHRVRVTDAEGCKVFKKFYLKDLSFPEVRYPLFTPHIENTIEGQAIGQIRFEVFIGNTFREFTYEWSHDSNLTSNEASDLGTGDYTVTITDPKTEGVYVRTYTILEEELTDISDEFLGELKVYPTLANQTLYVDLPSKSGNYLIEVFNHSGQKMQSQTTSIASKNYSLEVNSYPKGIYFVSMSNEEGKFVGKFVRQ
ncbi:MAG: T9SS type A sorting domain-containing protein [Chitinophagales bacterium]